MIELKAVRFRASDARGSARSMAFTIEDGAWVAVAGGNGSGKTSLCRIIAGLERPVAGAVFIDGEEAAGAAAGSPVGIAFQNPDSQFVTATVEREILFGMENRCVSPREMRERLAAISRALDLDRFLSRNPHTLSGGEKQRVVLASLQAMAPRHLVLDEPFSFLDTAGRAAFLDALRGLSGAGARTIVWATVNEAELALAERVLFLHEGAVRYDGPPEGLTAAVPAEILDESLVRDPCAPSGTAAPSAAAALSPAGGAVAGGGPALVRIRDAVLSPGAGFALPVADLSIGAGRSIGITGPSGSGKTTLLLACAGLLAPRRGTAMVLGNRIRSRRDAPVGRVAFLFQSPEDGFFAPTVGEEVALARLAFGGDRPVEVAVGEALALVGLPPAAFADRNPFSLSQGEKRLLAIASSLVIDAELVLLDEPTIFLDGAARARLRSLLERLHARGKTIVIASHDRPFLDHICDIVIELDR